MLSHISTMYINKADLCTWMSFLPFYTLVHNNFLHVIYSCRETGFSSMTDVQNNLDFFKRLRTKLDGFYDLSL